jgi:hypothetical protein
MAPTGNWAGKSLVSGLPGTMRLRGTQKVTAVAKNRFDLRERASGLGGADASH